MIRATFHERFSQIGEQESTMPESSRVKVVFRFKTSRVAEFSFLTAEPTKVEGNIEGRMLVSLVCCLATHI